EVLADGRVTAPGEFGEFICTGLLNADFPLIRCRLGDAGRLAPSGTLCACGRTLPALAAVDGRTNDLLLTRDGRRVAWFNPVWYGLPVRQGQIVQEALDRIRVRYVPAAGFSDASRHLIVQRLQERRNPWNYLSAWWRLRRRLARNYYDLVHAQFGHSGMLAYPKRLPLVVTFRGSDLLGEVGSGGRYTRAGRVLQRLSREVARHA